MDQRARARLPLFVCLIILGSAAAASAQQPLPAQSDPAQRALDTVREVPFELEVPRLLPKPPAAVSDPVPVKVQEKPAGFDRTAALEAVERGGKFLLKNQGKAGSWDLGPNEAGCHWNCEWMQVGVTAVVAAALQRAGIPGAGEVVKRGLRFIRLNGLKDETEVKGTYMNVKIYALVYGLSTEVRLKDDKAVKAYLKALEREWNKGFHYGADFKVIPERIRVPVPPFYIDPIDIYEIKDTAQASHQLALAAAALLEAKDGGYALPEKLLDKILDALQSRRVKTHGGFKYRSFSKEDAPELETAARSVACEWVLYKAGRSDKDALRKAVERFRKCHQDMQDILAAKHDPHSGLNKWSKYFYFFGVTWTAKALKEFPAKDASVIASELGASLTALAAKSKDGSLEDSPEIAGPYYGTASAMEALLDIIAVTDASR